MNKIIKKPKYTNADVKKAGDLLLNDSLDSTALDTVSYWRAEHTYSLDKAYEFIKKEAKKIDKEAFVAKRLKRLPSIIDKYKAQKKKNKNIKLTSMQDIAGCRIVVSSIKKVYQLSEIIATKSNFIVRDDYIKEPNATGYKSLHLIGKVPDGSGKERKVEIQIRTELHHSWATAVEIIDIFTNQKIKSNTLKNDWTKFFKNCSIIFGEIEKYSESKAEKFTDVRKRIFGKLRKNKKPETSEALYNLFKVSNTLKANEAFDMYSVSIKATSDHIDTDRGISGYALIDVKMKEIAKYEINTKIFPLELSEEANKEYLELEKQSIKEPYLGTVALISTSAVGGIKEAYPNYFADSEVFLKHLVIILKFCELTIKPRIKPSFVSRLKNFIRG